MTGKAAADDVTSPEFFAEELDRALLECGYGLQAWETLPSHEGRAEARASIELSDQGASGPLLVVVDERGYWAETEASEFYPTLDDLLAQNSTFFRNRRQALLTKKLGDLARERSWPDNAAPNDDP